MLLAYVAMPRYEGPQIDTVIVENDAKALYKAGEKRIGTNYKTFICIFSERSRAHLAAVNFAYHKMYGHSLEKAIKKKTSGKFTYALLTILQCVENPGKFFAKGDGPPFIHNGEEEKPSSHEGWQLMPMKASNQCSLLLE
ncbi:hypothetical protein TEA_018391 [Camellia sinensis var. sinensis]|uniref:Uncharacterized protein n=1 Tax=Camellia sinensis var. sinensis TaxID=542762 RepID=A0A4S4CWL8_CAMSN|nr:hypothetical protein TEA_018391 [Camellia sinensis var. sinensis]